MFLSSPEPSSAQVCSAPALTWTTGGSGAATAGADDGELFLERKRSEAIVLDDGRIKTASYDASEGFGLRAVRGEVAGYAHSTEISESSLRRAAETARLAVGSGGGTLAAPPRGTNTRLYRADDPILLDWVQATAAFGEVDAALWK